MIDNDTCPFYVQDGLAALEELVLTRNRISSFPKDLFRGMKALRTLELNRNRFKQVQGLTFHGLERLKVLRMRRNQVGTL